MSIRPLCATITPFPDESLASILVRSADANSVPRVSELLRHVGFPILKPAYFAFTRMSDAEPLAAVLGLPEMEIRRRMHPKILDRDLLTVDWFGTPLERRFIEAEARRVPTDVSENDGYGTVRWMVRPLKVASGSGARLIHECPSCSHQLGWTRAVDLWRCEKCNAPLRSDIAHPEKNSAHDILAHIEGLIDPYKDQRSCALARLPVPFRDWEGGDVFAAIVDLGVIAQHPGAEFNDPVGRCVGQGDFSSLTTEGLLEGWKIVAGWPDTFIDLVGQVSVPGAAKSTRWLEMMGPFARHLHPQASDTPFRSLIRASLPEIVSSLNLPVKRNNQSTFFATPRATTLTVTEAVQTFNIDNRTLARLSPHGQSVVRARAAGRRITLLNDEMLRNSVGIFRRSPRVSKLSSRFGVPGHVIRAFLEDELLKLAEDHDAQLLAGNDPLIDADAASDFAETIGALPIQNGDVGGGIALRAALHREINPLVWSGFMAGICDRSIGAWVTDEEGEALARVRVSRADFDHALARNRNRTLPDFEVPAVAAAPLLWTTAPVVGAAEKAGLLARSHAGFSLSDLQLFRAQHVFPAEVRSWFGRPAVQFGQIMRKRGAAPVAVLNKVNVWRRSDVRLAFPESANAEYAC